MKIGFLTSEFPHSKTGGAGGIGTSLLNLTKGLVEAGHEVTLLIYGQKEDEIFEENGILFHRIKNIKVKGFSRFLTQKKIEKRINSLVQKQQLDLVEAADWTGITSFIKPKCPIIIRLHGSDTYFCHLDQRPVKAINRFHEKRALEKATALVSVSQFTAKMTNEIFGLQKKYTIIPNAVDVSAFSSKEILPPTEDHTLLYFGTLIRKKGSLELPLIFNEVFKKYPNARLILAGRDSGDILSGNRSTWEMMKGLFDSEPFKNVTYLGSIPYNKIKENIHAAAICIFPTFAEALPVSWIEAMVMQKAIVASDIGWATEIIEDGRSGFLVYPKRHQEFANRIVWLLENSQMRQKMGAEAKNQALKKFELSLVSQQNIAFYEAVLKDYSSGR